MHTLIILERNSLYEWDYSFTTAQGLENNMRQQTFFLRSGVIADYFIYPITLKDKRN